MGLGLWSAVLGLRLTPEPVANAGPAEASECGEASQPSYDQLEKQAAGSSIEICEHGLDLRRVCGRQPSGKF